MGVFARLLGKKPKATEELGAEVTAGVEPAGSEAEDTAQDAPEGAAREAAEATAAKASGSAEDEDGSHGDDGPGDDGHDGVVPRTEPESADAVSADESTEIPKQQSAKEAADNEAGENART
ncbi:hypothetical protein ABZ619_06230 [Streptomyces sp. NPDC007851]|uniref:hypothetical protein n=1 Tax=Streptomyces sp. NPDC007851 TaxID=3155008 RepID=UPI0033F96FC4